ncbi:conserved hypothetical protein [Talaromyces stipitatus ATCC 10500]|uniref:Uncharacterized protein n=1 Tax=Talaromyces stipitatus (strain ATCC 10500 / CBS 375.48 / QM 6759 / NRRL 1006) TaxID=441959 RepID=B8MBI0_TALSN|nr:uncharacterized protein TSTA_116340 [Talaromyces stipitatus ATCC 10500]EED17844.1 conserved hypothetical protein [Talaromyces stipitatus ATCC 10500]
MSPVNSLWFKWKALKLPWRRSWVVGQDLSGNTFWEFRDAINTNRLRRIVKYNNKTHYGDVKITPQWHQWLRYVRQEPPSLEEQRRDIMRQIQIKKLAQIADEKWAAKPSYLDKPQTKQTSPATRTSDKTLHPTKTSDPRSERQPGVMNQVQGQEQIQQDASQKKTKALSRNVPTGPGEKWQPEAWTPDATRR